MTADRGTLDRFSGALAIIELEDKSFIEVGRSELGGNVKEGDKVVKSAAGIWQKDEAATREAKKKIRRLMDDLFE